MPTQWSEAEQVPLGCIAPPRPQARPSKASLLALSFRASDRCHWRGNPRPQARNSKASLCEAAQCSHWVVRRSVAEVSNPKVLTEGEPFTHHLLAFSFRASDRCHWRGNPRPQAHPPPHSNSFNFFSTKSSQNPLPAFKFFQGNYRFFQPFRSIS